jgi:predicted metalloendopeptidase
MDESGIEQKGIAVLDPEFARIAALQCKEDLPALIGHFSRIGVVNPLSPGDRFVIALYSPRRN